MLIAAATDYAPKSLQELKAAVVECKVGKEDQKGVGAAADSTVAGDWVAAPDLSSISRTFIARNFQTALDWVVAAGAIAEKQGHHPDLHITEYRQVMLIICPQNPFPKAISV